MTQPTSLIAPTRSIAQLDLSSRISRALVLKRLQAIQWGELIVVDGPERAAFGAPGSGPRATVRIHSPDAWAAIAWGGSLGAGESFMEGRWSTDDLVAVCASCFALRRDSATSTAASAAWAPSSMESSIGFDATRDGEAGETSPSTTISETTSIVCGSMNR